MTALALLRLLPDNGRVSAGSVRLGSTGTARPARVADAWRARRAHRHDLPGAGHQPEPGDAGRRRRSSSRSRPTPPLRGAAARAKAIEWMGRVGIPEPERRIDDYPFRLSGGQKQRVMIAIALAAEPDFLVADEPTTALDVTIQKQILDLLRDLQRERGMGMLLITHDLAVVAGMAQHVALMYAGPDHRGGRGAGVLQQPAAPLCEAAAARRARRRQARRHAGRDRRHRAAAVAALRRLPLRAPLRPGTARLPQHATAAASTAAAAVRCAACSTHQRPRPRTGAARQPVLRSRQPPIADQTGRRSRC